MTSTNPIQKPVRPSEVLKNDNLSREQKEEYLENWRLDLLERVRATEENMLDTDEATDNLSDQLREVDKALAELRGS